jgi:hydroxypyruvate isomerase
MTLDPKDCSACIEMLFTGNPAQRIHQAHQAGYAAVEFWHWSNKDIPALAAALRETGLAVAGFVAEPMIPLNDPANHATFLAALPASIATARQLGARFLYVQGGVTLPDTPRTAQTAALVHVLQQAADLLQGSGITLLLEPVSDAQNGLLTLAADGIAIVATVARPEIRLLLDLYHAAVAGEDVAAAIGPHTGLIAHLHLADHPGRGAPGTGTLPLAAEVNRLRTNGYAGLLGMEHHP